MEFSYEIRRWVGILYRNCEAEVSRSDIATIYAESNGALSSMISEFRKILESSIDPRTAIRKRKAAVNKVSLVPTSSALNPQIIAPSVIAPWDRTIKSALIRPRMEFGIAR